MPDELKPATMLSTAHRVAWSGWKRKTASISVVLSFVALASGTLVKLADAGKMLEPKLPVTYGTFLEIMDHRDKELRVLVGEHEKQDKEIAAKIDRRTLDLQLDLAKGKRDAARSEAYRQQDKMDETADPEKKGLYRDRMREFNDTKSEIEAQIKTLNKMRGTDQ